MTRAELLEAMARAICADDGYDPEQKLDQRHLPRWMGYRENATAALAVIEAAGMVVVPREATPDQQLAAFERDGDDGEMYASIYRAMVAASPVGPA